MNPSVADQGDKLVLVGSWAKGGRPREIPIRTEHQREVLDRAHKLAGTGALIRPGRNYKQQRNAYDQQCRDAGLTNMHGLRHAYAQMIYREQTGRDSPVAGGTPSKNLSKDDRQIDRAARLEISSDLGHGREQISANYLGR